MTVSTVLAEYVAQASYACLPPAAVRAAKASLVDTLAVAIAARAAPGVSEVIDLAVQEGGRPASSLWARQQRVPPRAATFANGFIASALDFDSLHQEGVAHADIVIVPAAVAVCEELGASGKALLTAIAVGDDLLCRLCRSTRLNTGWFYTSLYGPIASAAITARLLGSGSSRIAAAMGIGFMSASGTQQPAVERSMGKRMLGALSAAAGVQAGYLGHSGLAGPREILEGRFGLYAMHEQGDAAAVIQDLGTRFENARIGFKLYPSCQCNHAAIEGMLKLKGTHMLSHLDVERIDVAVSPYMQRLVGAPFEPQANPQVAAQFSIQYSIACVLLFGRLGVREISEETVLDPRIAELVRRIFVTVDPANGNNYAPVLLRVTTKDGRLIEEKVDTFRGSEERPLTDSDLKDKLTMCIEAAGASNAQAKAHVVFDSLANIEDTPDVTALVSALLARCFH
jgi:2-methylcitrate dehydratase PrpD